MSDLGQWAAGRHEIGGLSWSEILGEAQSDERWTGMELDWLRVRDHARTYIKSNPDEFPGKPGIEVQQSNDNVATVYYRGPQIQTPQDLLDYIGWDPAEWECTDRKVKTYQQASKREDTHLDYQDGSATGVVDKGGVIIATMFSVYVKLVRRCPVAIEPAIAPIVAMATYRSPAASSKAGLLRHLVLPDPHFGFRKRLRDAKLEPMHDRLALDVALQIAKAARVDGLTWLGDDQDMAEWSGQFTKSPEFYWTTQPALLESHWHKAQFRKALPKARHLVLGGNHDEKRLADALADHLPAAYGLQSAGDYRLDGEQLLSLPHLLGLESLGIEYVGGYPDAVVWLNERVALEHGDNSKLTAGDFVTVCGHYHRREWISQTRWTAKGPVVGESFCPGMLGRIDGLPGRTERNNWQQGIALIDYDPTGTAYSITSIGIENGRAVWNGRLFEGRDRVEEIVEAWPGWNW